MLVPSDDIVCRFIRPEGKWSKTLKRPKPDAFSDGKTQKGVSLWHRDRLHQRSVALEQLRLGGLKGSGQIHYSVSDYYEFAEEASIAKKHPLPIRLEWRTAKNQVPDQWWQWRHAHAEVLLPDDPDRSTLQHFRHLLSIYALERAKCIIPPDRFK